MSDPQDDPTLGCRGPDIAVALLLLALAALVIFDSVRLGTGWADDGPRSGYFPFYIGLLLAAAGGAVLFGNLRRLGQPDEPFAKHSQLKQVLAVLLPMVVYVAAIAGLGIYLASALLIGWFMVRHGRYGATPTVAVSIAVPLVFFVVFERWFHVLLPKGPIERWLGF